MNHDEAKEIIESHGVIEVVYQGSPVWIEELKNEDRAQVVNMETNQRMDVSLEQLRTS